MSIVLEACPLSMLHVHGHAAVQIHTAYSWWVSMQHAHAAWTNYNTNMNMYMNIKINIK
jgi:hypothetical protein